MRKCPRTLDKPFMILGLEMEDIAVLVLFAGLLSLFVDPFISGGIFFCGWVILKNMKKNKPLGYVMHYLYKKGLVIKGLIPPVKNLNKFTHV